jgi:hypothetical protein
MCGRRRTEWLDVDTVEVTRIHERSAADVGFARTRALSSSVAAGFADGASPFADVVGSFAVE